MSNFVRLTTKPIRRYGQHMEDTHAHNLRTDPSMSRTADPDRSHLNQRLVGRTDETLREAIYNRIEEAGVKVPENATVIAQEIALGASPEYFRPDYHRDDPDGWGVYDEDRLEHWKKLTMEYLFKTYGEKNVICADLHLDERTPHIQAIVVPITEVTRKKRRTREQIKNDEPNEVETTVRWNRSKVFGKKSHYQMQEDYGKWMEQVGLQRGIPKKITRLKSKEVVEWHKERRRSMELDETKRASLKLVTPKIRKKKPFESARDYIKEMLQRFDKATQENRRRFNKQLREAEDAKRNAEKIAIDEIERSEKIRSKIGILAYCEPDEIIEALDYLKNKKEQEKLLKQENKKKNNRSKDFHIQ